MLIDHDDELEPGGCSVLLQKVRHVNFDRGFRDGEGFGYIGVGQAVAQQVQDFLLRLGQVRSGSAPRRAQMLSSSVAKLNEKIVITEDGAVTPSSFPLSFYRLKWICRCLLLLSLF